VGALSGPRGDFLTAMVAFVACTSAGQLQPSSGPVLVATTHRLQADDVRLLLRELRRSLHRGWNVCGRQDDEASVVRCADTCKQICASDHSASPSNCEVERNACRWTHRNGICVDNLEDDTPEGTSRARSR